MCVGEKAGSSASAEMVFGFLCFSPYMWTIFRLALVIIFKHIILCIYQKANDPGSVGGCSLLTMPQGKNIIYVFVYWILLPILLDSKPPSSAARSALVSSQLSWELNLV